VNTDFNYYDFLKKKEFKYDVKVDLSGINLQGDATTTEVDPDTGEASEVNLNETVDENVNYVYNLYPNRSITYPTTEENANGVEVSTTITRYDGQDVVEVENIDFDTSDNPVSITVGTDNTVIPIVPRHTLMQDRIIEDNIIISTAIFGELEDSLGSDFNGINILNITTETPLYGFNIPFTDERVYQANINETGFIGYDRVYVTIEGADTESMNGEFEVSVIASGNNALFNIRLNDNTITESPIGNLGSITQIRINYGGYAKRTALIDRDVYAALGLWDTNNLNVNQGMDISDRHAAGFLSKKNFYSRLGALSEKVTPLGIEVITNEYRRYEVEIDDTDTSVDINVSHLPYNRNFRFDTSITAGNTFINRKNINGELLPLSSDDITPFTLSVKDAFTAQFATAEELNAEFIGRLTSLIDAMKSNPIIYAAVDLDRFTGTDPSAEPAPVLIKKYDPITPLDYGGLIEYAENVLNINVEIDGINAVAGELPEENADIGELQYSGIYTASEDSIRIVKTENVFGHKTYELDPNPQSEERYIRTGYRIYETYNDTTEDGENIVRFMYEKGDPTGNKIIKHTIEYNDSVDISETLELVDGLEDMMGNIRAVAALTAVTGGASVAALVMTTLRTIERRFDDLDYTIKRIRWFQKYTNQSVFDNGGFISENRLGIADFNYNRQMSRILIPVDFGTKKVKYKKKNFFGFKYNAYKRIDLGIRWVELSFIDTSTFSKYRKNEVSTGKSFTLNIPFTSIDVLPTGDTVRGTLLNVLPDDIMDRDQTTVNITISDPNIDEFNGEFVATIIDDSTIEFVVVTNVTSSSGVTLVSLLAPLMPTEPENDPENIRVTYNMPHLPFDDELRDKIFNDFGPFDQSAYSNKSRGGDYTVSDTGEIINDDDIPGWEIFKDSSKEISAMREGIDIYNKTEFLFKILQDEFGRSRVNIIETSRSFQDQEYLQLGGSVSSFLSWHNYGLAIKIVITQEDGITPIKDGTADQMRLLNVAEGFCEGAKNGAFGNPMNVVWCGQLVTGPDLFGWEFLPIGVDHKDALKFRDSIYQQKDPVVDNSYVNVTANNYIIESGAEVPDDNSPYILASSKGITDGIKINDEYWVHPKYIINYTIPSELILKDVQEFLLLVKGKMNANGTSLIGRKKISEWKSKNPRSFTQLVLFYGLTGSLSTTRKLLSGDYIEKFQNMVNTLSEKDPVRFVKRYLGDDQYANIKIYLEQLSDSSYINLSDGTMTTPVLEARSSHPEGSGNTFGQKQVDYNSVEFGQFQNGVFIPEGDDRIIELKTTEPVIDGYVDGVAYESDAVLLHTLIANQIVDEFDSIKEAFNTLSIKFMHDKFFEGSNSSFANLLENEFGVISTQDVMTFDALRKMYNRIAINSKKTDNDGGVRGAGANIEAQNETDDIDRNKIQSVFEKLVSNSQLTGIKRASLTKEKPLIEPLANEIKVEDVIEDIQNRRIPKVCDIL
jgi:hypothetical protein